MVGIERNPVELTPEMKVGGVENPHDSSPYNFYSYNFYMDKSLGVKVGMGT